MIPRSLSRSISTFTSAFSSVICRNAGDLVGTAAGDFVSRERMRAVRAGQSSSLREGGFPPPVPGSDRPNPKLITLVEVRVKESAVVESTDCAGTIHEHGRAR